MVGGVLVQGQAMPLTPEVPPVQIRFHLGYFYQEKQFVSRLENDSFYKPALGIPNPQIASLELAY